ncbi:MAG: helix-turn-helix domain-containing protein [Bacteroidia bacterium]
MQAENKPLFTLTIGEFAELTRKLVEEAISSKENEEERIREEVKKKDSHFTIKELADFLRCSKVSIHKYKKIGLPFYKMGRKILFKKQEVLNFMRSLKSKRVIEA